MLKLTNRNIKIKLFGSIYSHYIVNKVLSKYNNKMYQNLITS